MWLSIALGSQNRKPTGLKHVSDIVTYWNWVVHLWSNQILSTKVSKTRQKDFFISILILTGVDPESGRNKHFACSNLLTHVKQVLVV